MEGQRVLSLCSNNYLGLAGHPHIVQAVQTCLRSAGYGSAASRHISGSEQTHLLCERELAEFLNFPRALFFSSGYAANVGTIQALVGAEDVVFSDELNHASLIDGMRLSRAKVHVYRHNDMEHLRELLRSHRAAGGAALIVTDSVFSMDGHLASMAELRALADSYDAALVVDEAHAVGILGPQGRGLSAATGVRPEVLIAPLGKAFGTMGAAVAADLDTLQLIENRARSYVFSTAAPPTQAAAVLAATELVRRGNDLRLAVLGRIRELAAGLRELGFEAPEPECPILPVHVGRAEDAVQLSTRLFAHRVFAHAIRPPTVPSGTSRLRLTVSAMHQPSDIAFALQAFAQVRHD